MIGLIISIILDQQCVCPVHGVQNGLESILSFSNNDFLHRFNAVLGLNDAVRMASLISYNRPAQLNMPNHVVEPIEHPS